MQVESDAKIQIKQEYSFETLKSIKKSLGYSNYQSQLHLLLVKSAAHNIVRVTTLPKKQKFKRTEFVVVSQSRSTMALDNEDYGYKYTGRGSVHEMSNVTPECQNIPLYDSQYKFGYPKSVNRSTGNNSEYLGMSNPQVFLPEVNKFPRSYIAREIEKRRQSVFSE